MRRPTALVVMAVLAVSVAGTSSGAVATLDRHSLPPPATVAAASGQVIGVTQDEGSVAWLEATSSGCRLRVRAFRGGAARIARYARGCLPAEHDLALARGRAAWGGYEEVRCSDTHAAVYTVDGARARLVQEIPGDCLGYGTAYQGLADDGASFFYSLIVTRPRAGSSRCGEGGPCRWQLASGQIVRIAGSRPVTVRGLPPAVLIAAAAGRIALVEPAAKDASNGRGPIEWPHAAPNGKVEVRDSVTRRLVTSFRPHGTVRAIALSAIRAVVLVKTPDVLKVEWYDSDSGARLGTVAVPGSTARRLSTDGRFVAYAAGKTVRSLDLETGLERVVARSSSPPVGLSVREDRLVWGENIGSTGRIRAAELWRVS
jgi:hypothetical protein